MHIETVHIHIAQPAHTPEAIAAMERLMRSLGRSGDVTVSTALTPPEPGQPWPGQGGIYIGTLPAQFGLPERHLIAASQEREEIKWGGSDTDSTGATSHTDGRTNTAALVASTTTHPAAEYAAQYTEDGHTDYFLGSRFDMFMCHLSAPKIFKESSWYWTSTQYSRHLAFVQAFAYGYSGLSGKSGELRARPLRLIQL